MYQSLLITDNIDAILAVALRNNELFGATKTVMVRFHSAFPRKCQCDLYTDEIKGFHDGGFHLSYIFAEEHIDEGENHHHRHDEPNYRRDQLIRTIDILALLLKTTLTSLTTFSLTIRDPIEGGWCACYTGWLSSEHFCKVVQAIPESCANLELDTGGTDGIQQGRGNGKHLCQDIQRVLPKLHHLRLRVAYACHTIWGGSVPASMYPQLRSFTLDLNDFPRGGDVHNLRCSATASPRRPCPQVLAKLLRTARDRHLFPSVKSLDIFTWTDIMGGPYEYQEFYDALDDAEVGFCHGTTMLSHIEHYDVLKYYVDLLPCRAMVHVQPSKHSRL